MMYYLFHCFQSKINGRVWEPIQNRNMLAKETIEESSIRVTRRCKLLHPSKSHNNVIITSFIQSLQREKENCLKMSLFSQKCRFLLNILTNKKNCLYLQRGPNLNLFYLNFQRLYHRQSNIYTLQLIYQVVDYYPLLFLFQT